MRLPAAERDASLDQLVGGDPLWPSYDPSPTRYPALTADTTCDVCVIGAGVSGALIAYELSEAGLDVVLVERDEVAGGSTSANTALLLYETDVPLHRLAERIGESSAVRVYRLCRDALTRCGRIVDTLGGACGFAARTSLYLASRAEDVPALRREHELRRRHGFMVDLLEREAIEARYAFSRPAGLLSHDAGELDPVAFTRRLVAHIVRRGARAHERTAIERLDAAGEGVELVTVEGCRIRAGHAILATGYESERYLGRRARQNSTYALATEPTGAVPGWPDRTLIWETARPYLYLRTTPDGRILVGGLDEQDVRGPSRDALLPEKRDVLLDRLRGMFSELDPQAACAWCGTFLNTGDSLPYVGPHPDLANVYVALCYGGNGTTFGLVAGELLRDLVLGRSRPEAGLFRLDR